MCVTGLQQEDRLSRQLASRGLNVPSTSAVYLLGEAGFAFLDILRPWTQGERMGTGEKAAA